MDEDQRVVLCSKCGATVTEDKAFQIDVQGSDTPGWICQECTLVAEAMDEFKRTFASGAIRDNNTNKLAYDKGLSTQVLQAYMEYLGRHRTLKDGSLRDWDNWKQGIPIKAYRESLLRHSIDALRKSRGLGVPENASLKDLLCAVIFNASGWLFELLVEDSHNRELDDGE